MFYVFQKLAFEFFFRWINCSPSSGKLQNVFCWYSGICLLALDIRVKTLRENYSWNYEHQLKRLKRNKLKLNKWNNYQAYFCDNFWHKRKVEMRKFHCNSFRITGNTNFKKKLTSFVSRSVWGNPAIKVKVATEIRRHTAGAEAVVFRPFSQRLLWMNTEEQNNTHRSYFLKNLFENPNVSVLKWNSLIPA